MAEDLTSSFEIVKQFNIGENVTDLGFALYPGDQSRYYPTIAFTNGRLTIDDYYNKRIIRYDSRFQPVEYIDYSSIGWPEAFTIVDSHYGNIFYTYADGLAIYLFDKNIFSFITTFESIPHSIVALNEFKSFEFYKNILFIHDKNRKLWCLTAPGLDQIQNKRNLLNTEQTKTLIQNKWGNSSDIKIDNSDRLFINGVLQTRDFITFKNYYREINAGKQNVALKTNPSLPTDFSGYNDLDLIGKDSNGYFYWTFAWGPIFIFNSDGWIVKVVEFNQSGIWLAPAVSPAGDIYILEIIPNQKKINIKKLRRNW